MSTIADASDWIYQMQPNDNLWSVSKEYLADVQNWRKLKQLNNIRNHRRIPPGTRLRIPIALLKVKSLKVRVLSLAGEVVATSGKSRQNVGLTADTHLGAGDEIRTGADGSILLEFADGSRLLLQRNSQLLLDVTNAYGSKANVIDSRIRLDSGRIESEVPTEKNPSGRFEIRTPAATTGVRGTRYRVNTERAPAVSRIEVIEGEVHVSGGGETVVVPGGSGTLVTPGQAPQTPKPLLTAPDLSLLPSRVEGLPYELEWPPLAGAKAYRIQIHPSDNPGALLVDETLENPLFRVSIIEDGTYVLAVRAIDTYDLEGLPAQHRLTLSMLPEPLTKTIPPPEPVTDGLSQSPDSGRSPDTGLTPQRFLYLIPLLVLLLLFTPALLVLLA